MYQGKRKMKILTLTPWYPNPENKTNGTFVKEQSFAIVEHLGYDVVVISPFATKKGNYEIINNEVKIGKATLREILVPYKPEMTIFDKYLKRSSAVKRGFKSLEFKPDIFHVHEYQMVSIAKSLMPKIPVILTEHSTTLSNLGIKKNFARKAFDSSDFVIAVSQYQKEKILSLTEKANVIVVNNFVDDVFLSTQRSIKDRDSTRLISVGGLIERKGFPILIEALSMLEKKFELTIVGDGPKMNELKSLADKLKVSDRIVFKGALGREEVSRELSKSDIFVSASKIETFGIAILEALAVGMPVVTYDNGGISDFMKDFCGIVVSEYTPRAFLDAIKKIDDNLDSYNSQQIKEYVRTNFSSYAFARKVKDIFEGAINKKKR